MDSMLTQEKGLQGQKFHRETQERLYESAKLVDFNYVSDTESLKVSASKGLHQAVESDQEWCLREHCIQNQSTNN